MSTAAAKQFDGVSITSPFRSEMVVQKNSNHLNKVLLTGMVKGSTTEIEIENVVGTNKFDTYIKTILITDDNNQKEQHTLCIRKELLSGMPKLSAEHFIYVEGTLRSCLVKEHGQLKYQVLIEIKNLKQL